MVDDATQRVSCFFLATFLIPTAPSILLLLQARVVEKPLKNMNEKKISNPFDDDATTKSCSKITVVTKFSVWEGRFLNQDPVNSSTP